MTQKHHGIIIAMRQTPFTRCVGFYFFLKYKSIHFYSMGCTTCSIIQILE